MPASSSAARSSLREKSRISIRRPSRSKAFITVSASTVIDDSETIMTPRVIITGVPPSTDTTRPAPSVATNAPQPSVAAYSLSSRADASEADVGSPSNMPPDSTIVARGRNALNARPSYMDVPWQERAYSALP